MPIESPCISVCLMDDSGKYCLGCYRSGDEIENWITLSDEEKKNLISLLDVRRNNLTELE